MPLKNFESVLRMPQFAHQPHQYSRQTDVSNSRVASEKKNNERNHSTHRADKLQLGVFVQLVEPRDVGGTVGDDEIGRLAAEPFGDGLVGGLRGNITYVARACVVGGQLKASLR